MRGFPVEIGTRWSGASCVLVAWDGEITLRAEPARVWDVLHDVDCLKRCLPGCAFVERRDASRYDLEVDQKIGLAALRLSGSVVVVDEDPWHGYTLLAEGRAGRLGALAGSTRITFDAVDEACRVSYKAKAELTGPIAVVGSLMLPLAAPALCRLFAERLRTLLEDPAFGAATVTTKSDHGTPVQA